MTSRRVLAAFAASLAFALLAVPARAHDDLEPHREAVAAAAALAPEDVDLWLTTAELARLARDFAAAQVAVERAAALAPASPRVAQSRAALALDRGELEAARTITGAALGRGALSLADEAALQFLLGRIAVAQSRRADALVAYDRALAIAPRVTADQFLDRATVARAHAGPDESARGLAFARTRLPYDGALRDALARDLLALGHEDEARTLLEGWSATGDAEATRESAAFAPAPDRTLAPTLVARNAPWRWSTPGAAPPGSWKTPSPADTTWPAGPAPLGFGDAFIATSIPMGPTPGERYTTSYFRILFEVPDAPAAYIALTLSALYDDGFVAYLNGVELARRGIPAGPVLYGTFAADHEATGYETIDVTAALPQLLQGTNVLAVEVHQATSTSSDLAWDGELVATNSAPSLVRGPYLQNGNSEAITVRWRTNVATDSRVWIGPAPGALVPAFTDPLSTTEHEVRLTGLSPVTSYVYAVGSSDSMMAGDDASYAFRTSPVPGDARPTRVWVLGDSGVPGAAQARVRDAYTTLTGATPTDVWLMLGDNAYQVGSDAEYSAAVFTPYAAFLRSHSLWSTRGNHDALYNGVNNDYYDLFTLPTAGEAGGVPSSTEAWYSFDHGDIHFVCLDSEGSARTPGSPMLTWLAADLAATQRTWTIVFFHHPPYTKGSHDSDNVGDSGGRMRDMRENVLPILEAAGVDLVLSGHSHSYERSYLLDGHYGTSGTLTPAMILDAGDGDPSAGGDSAYTKPVVGAAPHDGEVFAVAGSSAQISGGTLNHPAMVKSLNVLGSLVVEVDGPRLAAFFLDDQGLVRDRFAIQKGAVVAAPSPTGDAVGISFRVAGANPFRGDASFALELPRAGDVEIRIVDARGRRVQRLAVGSLPAGSARVIWNGNDESGRRAPAGLYFAILDVAGERRVARLLRVD